MKKPFDLQFIFGDDSTGKQIASLNVDFELKSQRIKAMCQKAELKEDVGKDLILKFDFTTQEGRQKEAIEYFESGLDFDEKDDYDHDLSPLQNWFKRPKKSGKLDLYQSTKTEGSGRVTLEYRIYFQQIQEEEDDLIVMVQEFSKSDFHPDINLQMSFFGDIELPKKNRVKLKMQYIDFHLTSQEFKMKDFQNMLKLMKIISQDESQIEEIVSNPLWKFLHTTEELQAKIKMASARKFLRLYEIGITDANKIKEQKKQHPDIIKGLFKDEVRVTFIYSDRLAFIATYRYRSEAVFIRMLTGIKKYLKYLD